jgi:hypothetical protein
MSRFVNVMEWQFGDGSSGSSAGLSNESSGLSNGLGALTASPQVNIAQDKKRMKLKLAIYAAAQFKDKFPDLPAAAINVDPENRLDPTISDDRFNKLIKSP